MSQGLRFFSSMPVGVVNIRHMGVGMGDWPVCMPVAVWPCGCRDVRMVVVPVVMAVCMFMFDGFVGVLVAV